MFAFDRYKWKNFPYGLVLTTAALCILGYLVLGSAVVNDSSGAATMTKQEYGFIAGGLGMLFIALTDYHFWMKLAPLIYLAMIGLQGLLYTPLGETYKQATRWLNIGGIGQIQPSEFSKILMILFFAWFFDRFQKKMNKFSFVVLAVVLFAVPAVMIFKEPDLSSTLIFSCTFLAVFFIAGLQYKWIGVGVLSLIPVSGFLFWDSMQEKPLILKEYMLNRVRSFLYPEQFETTGINDQQQKAVLAISSGSIRGKGLFNSSFESVKNGNFLSEENCDFIFAVIGEEMGFLGSAAIILLFFLLMFFCFLIASRAKDTSGRLIAAGTGVLIALEVFVNIGVTSGLLPNTGIVLPFFSAGLSSLVSTLVALGFVFNVALQRDEKNSADR